MRLLFCIFISSNLPTFSTYFYSKCFCFACTVGQNRPSKKRYPTFLFEISCAPDGGRVSHGAENHVKCPQSAQVITFHPFVFFCERTDSGLLLFACIPREQPASNASAAALRRGSCLFCCLDGADKRNALAPACER